MKNIPCSVGILTYNSENTLRMALESVKNFDEIIICDGGSIDMTLKIANEYKCKIINQSKEFKNQNNTINDFAGVRNQMYHARKNDWFLYVDSDEYISQNLEKEIDSIISDKSLPKSAYWVPRKYIIDGEIVQCATTYPSWQMRFFHKNAVTEFIKKVHERINVKEGASVKRLKYIMLVPMDSDIREIRKKWDYYIQIELSRRDSITLFEWLGSLFDNTKVSILYLYRLIRNLFFCRGKRMPISHEIERHMYHLKQLYAFFWKIRF